MKILLLLCSIIFVTVSCNRKPDDNTSADVIWAAEDWTIETNKISVGKLIVFCYRTDTIISPWYISQTFSVDRFFNNSASGALRLSDSWTYPIEDIVAIAPQLSFIEPEKALALIRSAADRCTVTGNYWPLTKSHADWIDAAFKVYLATGDPELPQLIYPIGQTMLEQDYEVAYDQQTGLFAGLLDSNYTQRPDDRNLFIYSLRTNVVRARAFATLAKVAEICNHTDDAARYATIAESLVSAINDRLWIPEQGRYGSCLTGKFYPVRVDDYDNYGQALAILYDIATPEMAASIISATPMLDNGVPARFPTEGNPDFPAELQSLWGIAARKVMNQQAMLFGLASAMAHTFADTQLSTNPTLAGSYAPGLNAVTGILFGMSLTESGMIVRPVIPSKLSGSHELKSIEYRDMTLDIAVNGTGDRIVRFEIDGRLSPDNMIPADLSGYHSIVVTMANNDFKKTELKFAENNEYMASPQPSKWTDSWVTFHSPETGDRFMLYENGVVTETTEKKTVRFDNPDRFTVITASAYNNNGITSLPSREFIIIPQQDSILISHTAIPYDLRKRPTKRNRRKPRRPQPEHLEMTRMLNTNLTTAVSVKEDGEYFIDLDYWRPIINESLLTDLYVNGERQATFVMTERSGFTNAPSIRLKKGRNELRLVHRPLPAPTDNGGACLEYIRLIRKP